MVQVDLITGFLGSGKTDFYAALCPLYGSAGLECLHFGK